MPAYALTIFAGAFLLFQVQPLIGKYILPWFGGGPGVWTTCMLFFQVLLLGGYAYAYLSSRWFRPRAQAAIHLLLLLAALALLPITPADSWKPRAGEDPTLRILALLAASLGLPYFVLSSTGPLMQHWFSRTHPGVSPYRLFALSNAGSLLALISFPFYFETHFTRHANARLWGWGLVAYAICCAFCALKTWRASKAQPADHATRNTEHAPPGKALTHHAPVRRSLGDGGSRITPSTPLLWLLLPACASVLLLATTNKICQDVAVIPFLWVLPLALYLLSFIICFDNPRWYARLPFTLGLVAGLVGFCWALFKGTELSLHRQVGIYCGGLFLCCMVCHGELYRLRPDPRQLTWFYLMIAAGGALGGLFVAVAAPVLFTDYYELHCGLLLCAVLFVIVCATGVEGPGAVGKAGPLRGQPSFRALACLLTLAAFAGLDWCLAQAGGRFARIPKGYFLGLRAALWGLLVLPVAVWIFRKQFRNFQHWRLVACGWMSLGVLALGATLWSQARESGSEAVYMTRNFYGVLKVYEQSKADPKQHHFLLQHGRITHGLQFVDPVPAAWPVSYYGEESGIGLAVRTLPAGARRFGLVGLGTGTFTAYARAGDYVRIYEINPEVTRLAKSRFTYLGHCAGTVELVLGDARLSMEREPPQRFDLLVLDAFSSDAIPVHLLTKEAFEVYQRHLNPNAVIAVHISNHYLDLEPVVRNLARQFHYKLASIDYDEDEEQWWLYSSTWILLTRCEAIINAPAIRDAASPVNTNAFKAPLWTDDFTSLAQILR